jgi:predicted TIM-barrel fold metal-dependent hydrolase
MKNKTIITIAVIVVLLVVVGFFILKVTKDITRDITKREIARITQQEVDKITDEEIERITQQKTEEITKGILGGSSGDAELKEVSCEKPQLTLSADAYTGPLLDDHVHMPFTFDVPKSIYGEANWDAPILEKEVPASQIICVFDNTKTRSAIGFYVIPSLLKGSALQQLKAVGKKYPGRIHPFLMPSHVTGLDLTPNEYGSIIASNPGLFKGLGEFAFYKGSLKGTSPDDPSFMELYKIAGNHNLVVMIHPDQGQQQAIERILKANPTVNFLFHGDEIKPYLTNLLDIYQNAYYSIDTQLHDIPNEYTIANLYGAKSKEEFISEMEENFDKILSINIATWKPLIEKYPDRFLWGTDRAFTWHFDEETGATIEEITRTFIGQLDPSVQEKFAYKNAEKLLWEK